LRADEREGSGDEAGGEEGLHDGVKSVRGAKERGVES
jgi:hypothetical protein